MSCVKKCTSRNGFTLVELLIVIVVIGVLSAMMMLSSTEAVSSARASNIVSNLRNLKTAVLSWYADNIDKVVKDGDDFKILTDTDSNTKQSLTAFVNANPEEFTKYLGNENITVKAAKGSTLVAGDYIIDGKDGGGLWVVGYYIGNDSKIKEKLKARAESIGLIKGVSGTDDLKINAIKKYNGEDVVFLEVQRFK